MFDLIVRVRVIWVLNSTGSFMFIIDIRSAIQFRAFFSCANIRVTLSNFSLNLNTAGIIYSCRKFCIQQAFIPGNGIADFRD
jgi:hypothetical protein